MKTIELKITKETINGKQMIFTTYDLLHSAINQPVEGGFNVDEMKKRLRLLGEIDKHKETFKLSDTITETDESYKDIKATLELEDADYEKVKSLVAATKWNIVSATIIELSDSLK